MLYKNLDFPLFFIFEQAADERDIGGQVRVDCISQLSRKAEEVEDSTLLALVRHCID